MRGERQHSTTFGIWAYYSDVDDFFVLFRLLTADGKADVQYVDPYQGNNLVLLHYMKGNKMPFIKGKDIRELFKAWNMFPHDPKNPYRYAEMALEDMEFDHIITQFNGGPNRPENFYLMPRADHQRLVKDHCDKDKIKYVGKDAYRGACECGRKVRYAVESFKGQGSYNEYLLECFA